MGGVAAVPGQFVAGGEGGGVDRVQQRHQAPGEFLGVHDLVPYGAQVGQQPRPRLVVHAGRQHAGGVQDLQEGPELHPLVGTGDAGAVGGLDDGGAVQPVDEGGFALPTLGMPMTMKRTVLRTPRAA